MDWDVFWAATTAAATVATAISTSTVLVLQRRNRPEPDWAIDGIAHRPDTREQRYETRLSVHGRLINAGDGSAFRVTVTGVLCEPRMTSEPRGQMGGTTQLPFVAVVHPGDSVRMYAHCPEQDWDRAEVVISWTRSPTRLQKRVSTRIPLREIAPLPGPVEELAR